MNASYLLPGDLTLSPMDATFLLEGDARSNFLQLLMQSFGCRYICLWSFLIPSSYIQCLEGYYQDDADLFQAASSSSGSLAQRLFNEYKQSSIFIQEINRHNNVPGLAFSTQSPYIELGLEDLMRLSTNISQRQFYREARIKTAVFMGCRSGEIELGFSNVCHVDIEMQMKSLFPEHFSGQFLPAELPHTTDQQNPPSSSSSSLRSLSIDSPAECSSLLFNIPGTSYNIPEPQLRGTVSPIDQASQPIATTIAATTTTTITSTPHQALANIQGLRFPIPESEHTAMTNAFLAVLSSPSSSTTSPQQRQQQTINFPNVFRENYHRASPSSFRNYTSALVPISSQTKANVRRRNIIKRLISHCRSLHSIRLREQLQMSGRPTSNQLHHMMSERKRREKLNESFQALKSLLPPGTKKDKASVLATTREYLSSLKAQVDELRRKNAILEAQVLPKDQATKEASSTSTTNGGNNLDVNIRPVTESTSQDQSTEARIVDLQVSVRGDVSILQLVIRILEFLKQVNNVNLMSMEADARVEEPNVVNRLTLRLRVEGIEWDESAFQEAVRRVVADMAPSLKDDV